MFLKKMLLSFLFLLLTGCSHNYKKLEDEHLVLSSLIPYNLSLIRQHLIYESKLISQSFFDFEKVFLVSLEQELSLKKIVTHKNISSRYIHLLVNRDYTLPKNFIPPQLVTTQINFTSSVPNDRTKLYKEAARAAEKLFIHAEKNSIKLVGVSGYRSYDRQKKIFDDYCRQYGIIHASRFSAPPGASEHQTGLALDLSAHSVHGQLTEKFGDSKEGHWIKDNCAQFGFILRYPKNKESITGYQYEPWHLRYVGIELALCLQSLQLTLEEYIQQRSLLGISER